MKSLYVPMAALLLLAGGCYKSEISDKPAAEVSAPTADTAATAAPAGDTMTAQVIKEKSSIEFTGAKVTRDHKGKFNNFDGAIAYAGTKPASVNFDIDLNSMETDTEKLTGHLKTADFFDVAKYPKATFTSSALTETPGAANGATHELRGTLDMHGVKKDVVIPVKAEVTPEGVRTTSEFTINRHDWGISYRGATDDLIKDNVLVKLNLLFPPPPAA